MVYNYGMSYSKKKLLVVSVFLALLYLVSACNLLSGSGGLGGLFATQSEANWNGKTSTWNYTGSQVQYEVPNDVRTLTVTTNGPVDIFMVKMNNSSDVIPRQSTRYLVSASMASAMGRSAESSKLNSFAQSIAGMDLLENVSGISASGIIRKDYVPARDFVPPFPGRGGASRSASDDSPSVVTAPMKSVTPTKLAVGTPKSLWVDLKNPSIGTSRYEEKFVGTSYYTKRPATLRAVGEHCYIWVVDSYFSTKTASGSEINSTQAQTLATQFDKMYQPIQEVFGEESNKMIDTNDLVDISSASNTGEMVNIVVYDIEGDYKAGQTGGTMGYFWAKDYYSIAYAGKNDATGLTNCGKYFYVDSYFLNDSPQMLYSTLAHEFQHMINFGQKTMQSMETAETEDHVLTSQTWSNEMMSMVCEDMVQQFLGVDDQNAPTARLPYLCQYYYLSGLTDWLSGDYVMVSYAGAYAFGAYLARNYGGTALVKQIATNNYVDQEAITQALKSIGKSEDFDSVFRKYAQALVLDNAPSTVQAPSFNKTVEGISGNMKAIDIFNVQYQDGNGRTQTVKPELLKTDASSREDLRPYGFTLHGVGYTESASTINLTFSSPANNNEKVYLLVQPHKN